MTPIVDDIAVATRPSSSTKSDTKLMVAPSQSVPYEGDGEDDSDGDGEDVTRTSNESLHGTTAVSFATSTSPLVMSLDDCDYIYLSSKARKGLSSRWSRYKR